MVLSKGKEQTNNMHNDIDESQKHMSSKISQMQRVHSVSSSYIISRTGKTNLKVRTRFASGVGIDQEKTQKALLCLMEMSTSS